MNTWIEIVATLEATIMDEAYPLVGKQETTFGDIGLQITVARKGSMPPSRRHRHEPQRALKKRHHFSPNRAPSIARMHERRDLGYASAQIPWNQRRYAKAHQ